MTATRKPWMPPRWFVRTAWKVHKLVDRVKGGTGVVRAPARRGKAGMLRLRTTGRRSGQERMVIVAYWRDGDRYVTLAMNGWQPEPPAWWLNLQAHPDAVVETVDGTVPVRGRAATGAERDRLWAGFAGYTSWGEGIDRFAARRGRATPVVVLEPREA
ncbi:nitroreductase/quinone reductase family protein [Xylanimonas protaetiae]|uniref:Nitroreductase family deazaflavin-dependent oxidoreductase n=1 Tax=Xylanimonas protaetiae TaxID=2509457 RepID=A0A4P6FJZ2_9MICO|nr:nitroreductase/quinone reductase family protein [Xylanimonas protaetiae]QAY70938.1 nitroreductase family deazaflavin-dependent oxidoreductase [Xylanimonas protaetiae]